MIVAISLFVALTLPAQQRPATAPPRDLVAEIRGRLDAYEQRRKEDPAALAEIARLIMTASPRSNSFAVWSAACGSTFVADTAACEERLRTALRDAAAPLVQRAAAGAILVRRGATGSSELFYGLVKPLPANELATIAADLPVLPPTQAVPLLARALTAPAAAGKSAACRALGTIDTPESRQALADALTTMPSGVREWLACTVARARLNEPDATLKLSGISTYLEGEALLDAADAMLAIGRDEAAGYAAQKVARQGRPAERLAAARRLARLDPATAATIIDVAMKEGDPASRALALEAERLLDRAPSPVVRSQLADANELVRLRAAEAVLEWASRHK